MGSILTNGVFLPAEGERNCYEGLAANWTALDRMIGGYNAHIGNATIHVTAEDKEAWNGKADASALTAHTGDTTIHVTAEDKQAWDGHVADSVKHVTAEDKAKWDAVTSKANDSDAVHKSGNESIAGVKTFSDNPIIGSASTNVTISNTQVTANKSYSTPIGSNNSYLQLKAIVNYADSSPAITTTLTLTIQENAYSDGKKSAFFSNSNNLTNLGISGKRWANVYATNYYYGSSETEFSTKFVTTDTAQTISGNKTFSSINGVEPSSLGMPDLSNGIDISGYIDVSRVSTNYYTPPANGWISISVISSARDSIQIESSGGFRSGVYSVTNPDNTSEYIASIIVPCVKNDTVTIYFRSSPNTSTIKYAKFYPCQGNI